MSHFLPANFFNNATTETKVVEISCKLSSNQCRYSKGPKYGILAILQPGNTSEIETSFHHLFILTQTFAYVNKNQYCVGDSRFNTFKSKESGCKI